MFEPFGAPEIATASRSTSGTGSWPMTPTTTAAGSSWIGMNIFGLVNFNDHKMSFTKLGFLSNLVIWQKVSWLGAGVRFQAKLG